MSPPPSPSPVRSLPGSPAAIVAALGDAQRVLIVAHEHPDGDAVGSMLALRFALVSQGKAVDCALLEPVPARYRFLPGAEAVLTGVPPEPHDCAVALDCDGQKRLAGLEEAFRATPLTISIDHHQAERAFADLNWCDANKAATAVMVREVIAGLGVPLTPDLATCLYAALAADTGVFRFDNTNAEALALAAELVQAGADPADIARRAAEQMPPAKARLLGRALDALQLRCDGALVLATLSLDDFARAGALPEHTDGLVDELKRIEGAQVMALLREEAPGKWRASLRSFGPDVAAVCRRFDGGGHRLAAGCEVSGEGAEVAARITDEIAAVLEQC